MTPPLAPNVDMVIMSCQGNGVRGRGSKVFLLGVWPMSKKEPRDRFNCNFASITSNSEAKILSQSSQGMP